MSQDRSYIITEAGRAILGVERLDHLYSSAVIDRLAPEKFLPIDFRQRLGDAAIFSAFAFDSYGFGSNEVADCMPGGQGAWVYRLNGSPYGFKVAQNRQNEGFLRGSVLRGAKLAEDINKRDLVTPSGWLIRAPEVYMGLFMQNQGYMVGSHIYAGSCYSVEIMDWIYDSQQVGDSRWPMWEDDKGTRGEVGKTLVEEFSERYVRMNLQDFFNTNLLVVGKAVPEKGAQSGTVWVIDQYFPVQS